MNSYSSNPYYDYYLNLPSYVRMILDLLPEEIVSAEMRDVIKKQYNYTLGNLTTDRVKAIIDISDKFAVKVETDREISAKYADLAYLLFLKPMAFGEVNWAESLNKLNCWIVENLKSYPNRQQSIGGDSYGTRGNIHYR